MIKSERFDPGKKKLPEKRGAKASGRLGQELVAHAQLDTQRGVCTMCIKSLMAKYVAIIL